MRWFTSALSANPPPFWITFELDHRIMLFVLGLIVLSSLFAGGLPALQAARVNAGAALKDDSRSSTSGAPRPLQQRAWSSPSSPCRAGC